jgi:hypothetical protein
MGTLLESGYRADRARVQRWEFAVTSFYDRVPTAADELDACFEALLHHTEAKNGADFALRESWLRAIDAHPARFQGHLDPQIFARGLRSYDLVADSSLAMVALLGFVKVNAGEQYGVEKLESRVHDGNASYERLERLLMREELYHSRTLIGAAHQFQLPTPRYDYRPPVPLRVLIAMLARVPRSLFHSLVLATEVGGIKAFAWLLQRVTVIFPGQPALCDTLEERLVAILADEVSHVAFHRLCTNTATAKLAKPLSQPVFHGTTAALKEMQAIGMSRAAVWSMADFDYGDLPAEVKRRALFV